MRKKKPIRKNKKRQARVRKTTRRGKKRTGKKVVARMSPAVDVSQVEVLEVEMLGDGDVENISDADESEIPTEEGTDADFLLEFGGWQ